MSSWKTVIGKNFKFHSLLEKRSRRTSKEGSSIKETFPSTSYNQYEHTGKASSLKQKQTKKPTLLK